MLLALAAAIAVAIPAPQPVEPCFFNGRWVRRVVKWHHRQITQCFMHELDYRGKAADLQVTLHFGVAADGLVEWSDTIGEVAPAIKACIDREVESWTFWTGTSDRAEISYGIHFVLNSW